MPRPTPTCSVLSVTLGTHVRANVEWEVRRARAAGEQWQGVVVAELLGEKVKQRC